MNITKATPPERLELALGNLIASLLPSEKADLLDLLRIWDEEVLRASLCHLFEDEKKWIIKVSPLEAEPRLRYLSKMIKIYIRIFDHNIRFIQIYRCLKKITQNTKN